MSEQLELKKKKKPHWRGPFVVILSIPTAIGQQPCSSHSGSWLGYARWKLKHGTHPCSPLHTWTLTFRVVPCKVFPHVLNVTKRAIVGTSAQPYFVSCTHQQNRCYISSYTPQVCQVASSDIKVTEWKKKMQATFCHGKQEWWVLSWEHVWCYPAWFPWYYGPSGPLWWPIYRKIAAHVMML
jgi:hypothetical protein